MTATDLHPHTRSTNEKKIGTWPGVIQAELIRVKATAVVWFPAIGLLIGVLSSLFSLWSSNATDASGLLSWQAMYVTGMAAPILALLAGLAETREKKSRHGGTDIRPVSAWKIRTGRLLILVGLSGLFYAFNFGGVWLYAVIDGRLGAQRILLAGLLGWIGSTATIGLFSVIARAMNLITALLLAVAYQLAGTLTAEASWWYFFPPAWPVRLLLPTMGIHSNAVALDPTDPLTSESPLVGIVLNLVLAVAMMGLSIVFNGQRVLRTPFRPQRASLSTDAESSATAMDDTTVSHLEFIRRDHVQDTREKQSLLHVLAAINIALSRSAVIPLAVAAMVVLYVMAVIYPPSYISGAYTFALLPIGAGLIPVITWSALWGAWPIAVTENHRLRSAYLLWQGLVVVICALGAGGAELLAGDGATEVAQKVVLWVLTGVFLVLVSTALCIRFGPGVSIAAAVIWTIVSATLGGDVLADTILWVVAVPAWPETATSTGRWVFAVVTHMVCAVPGVMWVRREIRRAERRG